jgi:hypothetical protein
VDMTLALSPHCAIRATASALTARSLRLSAYRHGGVGSQS